MTNDKALEAALLPCPFCGGSDHLVLAPSCTESAPYDPADRAFPIVRCRTCYAEAVGSNWDHSCSTAIAAWNRRAPVSALPGEAEVVGLVKRLRTVSDMINMGEKIRWGEETSLMDQAADALQAMQARAEAAERERDDRAAHHEYFAVEADNQRYRAEAAEARVKEMEEALAYAEKGLDMIHNGLMDPTRPRQSVGEVCAHFLSAARTALSKGGPNG